MADRRSRGPAWPHILAGLAALGVAAIRTLAGAANDLAPILAALDGNPLSAVVLINWYALNAILGVLGAALLLAPRLSRPARRAIAALATLAFGLLTALFMGFTWARTGSPFTFPPWIPLALTTALCAHAARRG